MRIENEGLEQLSSALTELLKVEIIGNNVGEKSLWYLLKNNRDLEYLRLPGSLHLTGQNFGNQKEYQMNHT